MERLGFPLCSICDTRNLCQVMRTRCPYQIGPKVNHEHILTFDFRIGAKIETTDVVDEPRYMLAGNVEQQALQLQVSANVFAMVKPNEILTFGLVVP